MRDGFIKVAALSVRVRAANPFENIDEILKAVKLASENNAQIILLPELCTFGASAGDVYLQDLTCKASADVINSIREATADIDSLIVFGSPAAVNGRLYNAAIFLCRGELIGVVPKSRLSANEERLFSSFDGVMESAYFFERCMSPCASNMTFICAAAPDIVIGAFFDDDRRSAEKLREAGAVVLLDLAAGKALSGSADRTLRSLGSLSEELECVIVRAGAGPGESTTDMVYDGLNLIAENGEIRAASKPLSGDIVCCAVDAGSLNSHYRKSGAKKGYADCEVPFVLDETEADIGGSIYPSPFIPKENRSRAFAEMLEIQSTGLLTRIKNINCRKLVLGISGGLDSTLALICCVETAKKTGLSPSDIITVTMPCYGTTDRTYFNACAIAKGFGTELREISIKNAVTSHLDDIGHDISVKNSAYENAQARERTQVLMDIANDNNAIVVGTGDLSEIALGWATYNGDHMSMYCVNSSLPKTLIRELVSYYAGTLSDTELKEALLDVVATPVSPELLPSEEGAITQKTEDIVGPYELHDFFIYHVVKNGCTPEKIYRMARAAFVGRYDDDTIKKWLKIFYKRFFSQQFKRSCSPDGPQITAVSLSPRGGLALPSDMNGWFFEDAVSRL